MIGTHRPAVWGVALVVLGGLALLAPSQAVATGASVSSSSSASSAGAASRTPVDTDGCKQLKKKASSKVKLGPGKCVVTPNGAVLRSANSTIEFNTNSEGEITEIDLGDSGIADYESGSGLATISVTGGQNSSLYVSGTNVTVNATMTGGEIVVNGYGLAVNNIDNNAGGTLYQSTYFEGYPGAPQNTYTQLPGETNFLQGDWEIV